MANPQIKKEQNETISLSEIINYGDDVRKRILEAYELEPADMAPGKYEYSTIRDDIGLNIISGVDLGYAASRVGPHVAKRNPYIKELEYNVKLMEESPNALVILNGDLFSFVPKTKQTSLLSYETQVAYFYSLFKNLAEQGKIIAMVKGTEEQKINGHHKIDTLGYLGTALGIYNKVCNEALVGINLQDKTVGPAKFIIRTGNWQNDARTSKYIEDTLLARAVQKPGADIYVARTILNQFSLANEGSVVDGVKLDKPIYLISGGSYRPYKGSKAPGAEYNSVRDAELLPSTFWFRVSVTPKEKSKEDPRDYSVVVHPKDYLAHHTLGKSTDELASAIEKQAAAMSEALIRITVDKTIEKSNANRDATHELIRNTLENNKKVEFKNDLIREYLQFKRGNEIVSAAPNSIIDHGSDIERLLQKQGGELPKQVDLSDISVEAVDNTEVTRYINSLLSPEAAEAPVELTDDTEMGMSEGMGDDINFGYSEINNDEILDKKEKAQVDIKEIITPVQDSDFISDDDVFETNSADNSYENDGKDN